MEYNIVKVWFDDKYIYIKSGTGEIGNHPLAWFPRLLNATAEERNNFELSPFGIHWEKLDEDLSFEGFYSFSKDENLKIVNQ